MQKIPQADLNAFLSKDLNEQKAFVQTVGTAFEDIGFIALRGHFLDAELQTDLYNEIKAFFNLKEEIKGKYEIKEGGGQRGYTGFGKEHAEGRTVGDLKEFWHFGQDLESHPQLKSLYPENIHVQELSSFNTLGTAVFKRLEKTAQVLLQAIALYLDLEADYFDQFILEGNSILRAIHYPPITKAPQEAERAAAHGDINLITLLMGAQGSGLQVLNRQNQWIDAIAEPDELIINVGDMLSRLTNNRLPSTIHRVVNPPKKDWGKARYSLPFFMHPVPQMPLNCLPQTIDEEHPKKFDDITAGAFLNQRLIALGLFDD
ncbi:isopenicillin N synthase family oxygenase [Flavobacteriaceae bacterium]|nr:isopenicillin N synthase family oxygenase [Flavobacteriaceae bacterium]MDA7797507.1 isopenicillin N synthase family oxygenase [Flavobacteriaceae bacterium]MDA9016018.1 isopenicillin N synthase family oxygenase [Flavobacteriaceae bacterium]MDC3354690.1 isopenicillin N synthase family oxygenase [Flavobacteriaceae bacterium]